MRRARPSITRAGGASAVVLALAALAVAPGVAGSATPRTPAAPVRATLPPELQALEAKMALLQVSSERYSTRTAGSFTDFDTQFNASGRCSPSGPCHPAEHRRIVRRKRHRVSVAGEGEVTLSPFASEQLAGGRPVRITIGSTSYNYEPGPMPRHRARPWVRERVEASGVAELGLGVPFHGLPPEADLGGSGPYAGLINLLATATGPIVDAGTTVVDGQTTTRFTATVRPARLSTRLSAKQLAELEKQLPRETVDAYLSESGLPLRIVIAIHDANLQLTIATDLLAVNEPVVIHRPPARRTRLPQRDPSTSAMLIVSPPAPLPARRNKSR